MAFHTALPLLTIALITLPGCSRSQIGAGDEAAAVRTEAARLRMSLEPYRAGYQRSVSTTNSLTAETLQWLHTGAMHDSRTQAVSAARHWMDRWAKVYFTPRHMHEQLRSDSYKTHAVRTVHQQVLDHLKRLYFELHDYQRYAQHAAESTMHQTPPGRLSAPLVEFEQRLSNRTPGRDEITPLLDALPP